ncbi:DUF362 domain-containing protein [Clostridium folliculivorans]|uniref:DUF362 domain-containing protein n=1 Tax=Clostridium folliculivorans TaxID=2886038 RepID=A0A9W5Y4M5_9CLOT|nr:DUF362 domain-containing protein [Clostridium folliculivorans]GKU26482.1 hypothetical protein CFOLD11_33090 [Clostridium folliculivorans]GKU29086.1 hypothetical protein CFB3_11920 [Clostridium folliculivorans]
MSKSKVLFTKNITPESLVNIYKELGKELSGKVAVKVHSGEPGGKNFLKPEFMKELVDYVHGTVVECNTAYPGRRMESKEHWKAIQEHGFTNLFKVDIMDEEGELELPIKDSKHLKVNYVGSHLANYDSLLILSHFKGHQMGGFGGALKNTSIGIASSKGKLHIHTAGNADKPDGFFNTPQDAFLESMAEAASSIVDYRKDNIVFINVMRDISIDCDCNSCPKDPEMKDIGILASLDPVALDQACVDLVYKSDDQGKASLIHRMEEKHGIHTVEEAARVGVGSREYELIDIE